MTVKDFVKWIYPQARKMGEINPVFVTAQAALESGWGKSAIGNNLFGITKGSSWKGAVRLVTTTEYFSRPDVGFKAPEKVLQWSGFRKDATDIQLKDCSATTTAWRTAWRTTLPY